VALLWHDHGRTGQDVACRGTTRGMFLPPDAMAGGAALYSRRGETRRIWIMRLPSCGVRPVRRGPPRKQTDKVNFSRG
jgi:hypothetical protein